MKYLFLLTLCVAAYMCKGKMEKGSIEWQSRLPEQCPEDIIFIYRLSGGLRYYSEMIFISRDSCYYLVNNAGSITRCDFNLSGEELETLYLIFRDNNFDRIETYEKRVFDRGGENIILNWGKEYVNVSNSGFSFIEDKWLYSWQNCIDSIKKIAINKTRK